MIFLDNTSFFTNWSSFIGHFHPLLVHLPIGFLMIVAGLELMNRLKKLTVNQEVIQFILFITVLAATFSSITGYLLSLSGGYEVEMVDSHKWQGIGLTIFAWFAWFFNTKFIARKIVFLKKLYIPFLAFSTLLMFSAGHQGGALTHGENYLTENTPEPFRGWLGIAPKSETTEVRPVIKNINEALVFQDLVHPILKSKCEQCHNAQKSKGDLRMDTNELIKKGGKNGVILVAGNPNESEIIKRMLLPEDDEHHMPPKGKKQTSENEISLLKWWIEQGVPFNKKVSEVAVNESIKPILAAMSGGATMTKDSLNRKLAISEIPSIEEKLFTQKVPISDEKSLAEIKKTGAMINNLAQNNNFVEISYLNNHHFSDANTTVLSKLPEQTARLNLSNTQITDKSLVEIAKLKNLTRLHLENTKITDLGLANLKGLSNLEYLNLIGTQVSDSGIKQLNSCKNLKKIFIWQTHISEKGKMELSKMFPTIQIIGGIEEKQLAEFMGIKTNSFSEDKKNKDLKVN